MAEADWGALTGSALDTTAVRRGVSNAFTRPNGGGSFVHGFRSITSAVGCSGRYVNLANFIPIAGTRKGGSIRAAMTRYTAGDYSPFIGLVKGTDPATAVGYILGLTGETAYRMALRKGGLTTPLLSTDSSILIQSTSSWTDVGDTATYWKHMRLDVLSNPHGEVVLEVYENDLNTNLVTAPVWTQVGSTFIDDVLGALSESAPHEDGFYAVFGHITSNEVGATSLFDQLVVRRQTAP